MTLEIEVRSSGPGPRVNMWSWFVDDAWWAPVVAYDNSRRMGERWMRVDVNHRGRVGWCADGVGIIIRRAP